MNWRVVVAVVVALFVGAGAGALVEHQRVKSDSNKKSSSSSKKKTTTTKKGTKTTPVVTDWFGTQRTAACPALKNWNTAAVASYSALYQKVPWATTKVNLTAELDKMTAAYVAMERYANATGKTELAAQVAYQAKSKTALASASSSAAYLKAASLLRTAQVKKGGTVISAAVKKCGTA